VNFVRKYYPILFSPFFALSLYSSNMLTVSPWQLVFPILGSIAFALFVFFVVSRIVKSNDRASIISSTIIIIGLIYGRIAIDGRLLVPMIFVILGIIILFVHASPNPKMINIFFSVVLMSVLTVPIVEIARVKIPEHFVRTNSVVGVVADKSPDIYFLVFDRFASSDTLSRNFGYNNEDFLSKLEALGFFVSRHSNTNYPYTSASLYTSLNMEYLHDVSESQVVASVKDNLVVDIFRENGYKYVHIGSLYNVTERSNKADILMSADIGASMLARVDFYYTFATSTFLGVFNLFSDPATYRDEKGRINASSQYHRNFVSTQFDHLLRIPEIKDTTFTFMHMTSPHDPYVYNEDGGMQDPSMANLGSDLGYLSQLKYIGKRIIEISEYIISIDPNSVIIVQSDEGPFLKKYIDVRDRDWYPDGSLKYGDEILRDRFGILNAIYFPDKDYSKLYDGLSPINTFRIIFPKYIGIDYDLLEDRHFDFDPPHHGVYNFVEVTNELRR